MVRPVPTPRPQPSALACLLLGVTLLASACGPAASSASPSAAGDATPVVTPIPTGAAPSASSTTPSAGPSIDSGAVYDKVEQHVAAIRGLQPKRKVERQIIDKDELRSMITQQFDEETPPAYLAANGRLYKALGLIPADADLRDLSLDLLSGGVVGFYRNDQGKLYVVSKSGAPGPNERFYFAHEYDHALQDQNSTIFKDQHGILDQGDRMLARQAVYEGDATLTMTQWAAANLQPTDMLELLAASSDPEVQAVMARTPPIMRDTLTFPYTTGFGFVQAAQASGGWTAVNDFFDRMPVSTEQILHPEKYRAGEAPVTVSLPADLATRLGSGWSVPLQDTFGEYQMGLWLRESGVAQAKATDAAAGWGGDRLAVMEGPGGAWAVAMQTVWDTAADAAEFEAAATTALEKAGGVGQVVPGVGGKTRWVLIGRDVETVGHVANVLGLAG